MYPASQPMFYLREGLSVPRLILTPLLFTAFLLLYGCAGKNPSWNGVVAKPDNRTAFEKGGTHVGIWQTNDIAIHYRYILEQDRLTFQGQVKRQARIRYLHRLKAWVRIHFLDENGVVLDTRLLWAQNGSDVYGQIRYRFNRDWQIPPNATAMGFSYSGRASERGVWWDFWRLP